MKTPLEELIEKEDELALGFYNVNYSGTQTSEFLKPYIINTFKAARLTLLSDKERLVKACNAIQASRNELDSQITDLKSHTEQIAIGFSIWTEKNGWDWSGNHQVFINDDFEPKEASELFKDYMESLKP
jgi:hypothetical protein